MRGSPIRTARVRGSRFERLDMDEFFPPSRLFRRSRPRCVSSTTRCGRHSATSSCPEAGLLGKRESVLGRWAAITLARSTSTPIRRPRWPTSRGSIRPCPVPPAAGGLGRHRHRDPEAGDRRLCDPEHGYPHHQVAVHLATSMPEERMIRQLVIKDVAAEMAPVDFAFIRVLPRAAPSSRSIGLAEDRRGSARRAGSCPDSGRTTLDLTLRDAHVPGAIAAARLIGGALRYPGASRGRPFHELPDVRGPARSPGRRQSRAARFPSALHGVVRGTATLDSMWSDVRFRDADIAHIDGPGSPGPRHRERALHARRCDVVV